MFPKDKESIAKRAILYTGSNVAGLSVMMNTMGSQPESLKKDTENI